MKTVTSFYDRKRFFSVLGLDFSPIKGPEGNIEYLAFLQKSEKPEYLAADVCDIASASHNILS